MAVVIDDIYRVSMSSSAIQSHQLERQSSSTGSNDPRNTRPTYRSIDAVRQVLSQDECRYLPHNLNSILHTFNVLNMCCRRRHARRTPVVVVLGRMAYDKYKEHKAAKAGLSPAAQPMQEVQFCDAPGTAIEPPTYRETVGTVGRSFSGEKAADIKVDELQRQGSEGSLSLQQTLPAYEGQGEKGVADGEPLTKWEEKKANWAAKQVEKRARRERWMSQ